MNARRDFFSVRPQQIVIRGGHSYRIKISPTVHKTTESFSALPLEDRGCRYPDEMPAGQASMFKRYSFRACMWDCMIDDKTLVTLYIYYV